MEVFWNLQIPKSTKDKLIIWPSGQIFITGLSQSYNDSSYDRPLLGKYISEDDYRYVITALNLTIQQFWPCDLALNIGYFFAMFSFGVSLLLPNLCLSDAMINLLQTIVRMNTLKLREKGLELTYRSGWFTSWLELQIINPIEDVPADAENGQTALDPIPVDQVELTEIECQLEDDDAKKIVSTRIGSTAFHTKSTSNGGEKVNGATPLSDEEYYRKSQNSAQANIRRDLTSIFNSEYRTTVSRQILHNKSASDVSASAAHNRGKSARQQPKKRAEYLQFQDEYHSDNN